ncbi:Uncharacterised protein [Mycobacterium tuberculosis]|nr:Uncharacterised protein [Streptococcus pneumoniae]CKU52641.1 Uncharacterised protein [Mycobacterium tuberculosis]
MLNTNRNELIGTSFLIFCVIYFKDLANIFRTTWNLYIIRQGHYKCQESHNQGRNDV